MSVVVMVMMMSEIGRVAVQDLDDVSSVLLMMMVVRLMMGTTMSLKFDNVGVQQVGARRSDHHHEHLVKVGSAPHISLSLPT